MILAVLGLVVGLLPWPFGGSEESTPRTEEAAARPDLQSGRQRDPATGERPIEEESSADFFGGDLVVTIRVISPSGPGDGLEITRTVIRAEGSQRCDRSRIGTGEGVRIQAPAHVYLVEFRTISEDHVGLVAFRERSALPGSGCSVHSLGP